MLKRLFGRKASKTVGSARGTSALPNDVALCLETASVVPRHFKEEGPRAVIQIDSGAWVHSQEETRSQLLRRWPDLSDAQIKRAVRYVNAMVRRIAPGPESERRGWVRNW